MSTQPISPALSPELDLLVRRAAWIGQRSGGPVGASFTSLFLSLLLGKDAWSQWVQRTAKRTGVTLERVLTHWKEKGGRPQEVSLEKLNDSSEPIRLPLPIIEIESAGDLLPPSGEVRHLISAYIYRSGNDEELAAWGLHRERWAVLYHPRLKRLHPGEEERYTEHQLKYARELSPNLREVIRRASPFRKRGQPASAKNLLYGVLAEGARHATDSWFLQALGGQVEALLGGPLPPEFRLPDDQFLPLDEGAHELLDTASLLSTAAPDRRTHIRHLLLAALVSLRFPAPELLRRGRRKAPQLLDELLEWDAARGDLDDENVLRELVALALAARDLPEERVVVLNSDSIGGDPSGIPLTEDQLGISSDVRAMASVLASSSLKPPLSVGLFGDWGSGKSFFMGLLRKRIGDLAGASGEVRKAGKPTSFHSDIIQIEFNAWQYMDANLWASMIAHIFDQLSVALRERDKPPATKYLAELTSIREEQEALLREKARVHSEVTGVQARLTELEQQREKKRLPWSEIGMEILRLQEVDPDVRQGLDEVAARLRLDRSTLTVDEARKQAELLRQVPVQIAAWARSIGKAPWTLWFLVPLLVAVVPMFLARWQEWRVQVTGAVVAVLGFAREIRAVVAPGFRALRSAMERADAARARAREKLTTDERKARADEERFAAEEAKLEQRRTELAKRREELEAKLAELKDAASYKRFVLDRAASGDYRSQLGLITTIHRDLKTLSLKLKDATEEPHVDRIILYIDDLDRCPPDRVVDVLQAVHLILSLELFVVVVAVDSRWLLQSLEAYYRRHFGRREDTLLSHRDSDPQHYLEKIFQIPYALTPMTDSGFGMLVESLLGQSVLRPVRARSGSMRMGDRLVSLKAGGDGPKSSISSGPSPQAQGVGDSSTSNLTPRSLEIVEVELKNLQKLGSLNSGRLLSSPRAVKRMVNLYRIIRAGLDEGELDEFLDGRFRLHQLFLAAVVGTPAEAAVLLDELFEHRVSNHQELASFLTARRDRNDAWRTLDRAFAAEPLLDDWEAVLEAARGAARFSFQTGRILQEAIATASPGTAAPQR